MRRNLDAFAKFLSSDSAASILLVIATVAALIASNTSIASTYFSLAYASASSVNDGLMSIFFLLVGLEVRREILEGELATIRQSVLPIGAAVGGMLVPALCYLWINQHSGFTNGWGIPMATDIAFALGALSIFKARIPASLKTFLTALAIVDDIGAVLVIAIFYTAGISMIYLIAAGVVAAILCVLSRYAKHSSACRKPVWYVALGIALWFLIHEAGIHATLAGVVLAFCIPVSEYKSWEHRLHAPVSLFIVPLFALVNAGTAVSFHSISGAIIHPATLGIMVGLIIGKPIGIVLFAILLRVFFKVPLPSGATLMQVLGVGMLAGIGFTMSIFIAQLAFQEEGLLSLGKVAILSASIIAAAAGIGTLYLSSLRLEKINVKKM